MGLLKQQLAWISVGATGRNKTYPLVEEYFTRKALKECGYVFDANEIDDVTAHAFFVIDVELKRLHNKKAQKVSQKPRLRGR